MTRATEETTLLIIGAGPTGLGAGYRLRELGHQRFHIVERNERVGGLARSIKDDKGFTWDIGGHVLFSHYQYYDKLFETLIGKDYTLNDRESWVRTRNRWIPYPYQNNLRYLPQDMIYECLAGLIRTQANAQPKEGVICGPNTETDNIGQSYRNNNNGGGRSPQTARNFGEFIDAVFGDGIARHFMRPYNFKVWAHEPEMMNKTWIGERVAVIDYERALRNVILEQDDFGWGPNNRFKYPLFGTGDFYDRFEPHLRDHLTFNTKLVGVDLDSRIATFDDGSTRSFDGMLSTMPVDLFITQIVTSQVPQHVRDAASRLMHSAGHMVGIGIKRPCPSTKSWMYFPDDDCPFYRVTYLSNYSPMMTPNKDEYYSLLCEVSESTYKPVNHETVVEDVIRGLENAGMLEPGERSDIVSRWHYRAEYSYPTPSVERDEILSIIIPWLEAHGVYSRGRFGLWKYEVANTDHSVMQGVEWVNRLLCGEPEQTIGITYKSTEDGREAADHESFHVRPSLAGSGEKRT
ncbi:MAG: FAD-dependent oxidoreductase [Phycisphaeraceae bacterium]|nr:FAD-dependent oxidoreductase [Phycisphaerales bacterium]MCB9859802.1 FAD-dependent oxidoreductase [Phycisphaeraceae bacterium]